MPSAPSPSAAGQPIELPRGLIFLGSIWLTGSWLVSIGLRTPLQPVSASYTPGVRMMLLCLALGLIIGWPLLRLSQRPSAGPVRQTLLDVIVLLALVQLVIWPLTLVTPWSAWRTAAIDATLAVWLLLAAAAVASATGSSRAGPRHLAIICCLGLCLAGPVAGWFGAMAQLDLAPVASRGPIVEVLDMASGGSEFPRPVRWRWLAFIALFDIGLWGLLCLFAALRSRRSGRDQSGDAADPDAPAC